MAEAVGVIGLGIMGARMARNLARAGYEVHAWNRTRRPEHEALGVTLQPTPAAVGEAADRVITMVTDADALEAVAFGDRGFCTPLSEHPRPIHISMETIGGRATRVLATTAAADHGVTVVAAPVSGGSGGAEQGTLAIMASGERTAFERCVPLFDVLGAPAKRSYCGEDVGLGPDIKLDNNLNLLDGMVTMFLSCLGAVEAGIDPAVALSVFLNSTGDSVAMRGRCYLPGAVDGNPVDHGFAPVYKLKDALKDLRLWADKAREQGLPQGRVRHTIDLYEEAMHLGYAELDCSAILNVLLRRSGREPLPTILDAAGEA